MPAPVIRKLGTVAYRLAETTPVVWRDRLLRLEYVHPTYDGADPGGIAYSRFTDIETGDTTPPMARGFHLSSAFVHDDEMFVFALAGRSDDPREWGQSEIHVFRSRDLLQWSQSIALSLPGWELYNNSVCRGPDGFVMAFEAGAPRKLVGVPFTNFFAVSDDLIHWRWLGPEHRFSPDRYTACPAIRWHAGHYYMFYLEEIEPSAPGVPGRYDTFVVRSADLRTWQGSPFNPVLSSDDADRRIANPRLALNIQQKIAHEINTNNSDMDLCEHRGQVVMYYSWGTQIGVIYLAEARSDMTLGRFLEGWFA